ncbi:MAG TPA: carboxymuconolactone decarboxylase family protein [Chloroflexota bacterium]|nr:carboxymuconolactone decarboxylase family protein [Chloroflexota bacterium]
MADEHSIARGRELATSIWGEAFEKRTIPHLERLDPAFREFIEEFVFGEVWSRPGLDLRTRSLCTIASLASLGRTMQLEGHITGALANGASREEIVEVLLQMAVYAGFPAAWDALIVARRVFAAQDDKARMQE